MEKLKKILVVRTHYGHFTKLSGPGGFVEYLPENGYEATEVLVPLGHQDAKFANDRVFDANELITLEALARAQGQVDGSQVLALRALLDRLEVLNLPMSIRLEIDQFREINNI